MLVPNVEITKILFATDLSENARHAFAYAISLANLYEAQLVILHVQSDDTDTEVEEKLIQHAGKNNLEEIKKQSLEDARDILIGKKKQSETIRRVLNHFYHGAIEHMGSQEGLNDEILINSGDPVDEIINQASEKNCDLIVIGSHGHNSISDKMIGSTAEQVLRKSRTPVLMVRMDED